MKIKLIRPPTLYTSTLHHAIDPIPPLALGILAARLRKDGHAVDMDDLDIKNRITRGRGRGRLERVFPRTLPRQLRAGLVDYIMRGSGEARIERFLDRRLDEDWRRFDFVGISVLDEAQFLWSLAIARRVQKHRVPVVFGGAYMDHVGYSFFGKYPPLEYLIIRSGEEPVLAFTRFLEGKAKADEVPGLCYRQGSCIRYNPPAAVAIEESPLPDFSGLPLHLYTVPAENARLKLILPYQISAGCVHRCNYCNHSYAHKFQHKSSGKAALELKQLAGTYDTDLVQFADSNIFFSYEYLEALCDRLIAENTRIRWGAMSGIVDASGRRLDSALLRKMRSAGCSFLDVGVETGSDALRGKMNKLFSSSEAAQFLKASFEADIRVKVTLMIGYPHETAEDIRQTAQFIQDNAPFIFFCFCLKFYIVYGSPCCLTPEKYGIRITRSFEGLSGYRYEFEESGGLAFQEREKRTERFYSLIERAVHAHITRPRLGLPFFVTLRMFNLLKTIRLKNDLPSRFIVMLLSILHTTHLDNYRAPFLLKFGLKKQSWQGQNCS